jgi:hypothetical protein
MLASWSTLQGLLCNRVTNALFHAGALDIWDGRIDEEGLAHGLKSFARMLFKIDCG